MKKILLLILLTTFMLVLTGCGPGDLPPEPPAPGETKGGTLVGQAGYSGDGQFSLPGNFFSIYKASYYFGEKLVASINLDTFSYKFGYIAHIDDDTWTKIEYTGVSAGGNWLEGKGKLKMELLDTELKEGTNVLLAYACTFKSGAWDCHDNKWMAHSFTVVSYCEKSVDCNDGKVCVANTCVAAPEDPTELNSTDINPTNEGEVNTTGINPTPVNGTEINTTDINPTPVNGTEINTTGIDINESG